MKLQLRNHKIESIAGLIILLGGGVLIGTLIAPYVFNGILFLARNTALFSSWRDIEFEKVGNRCVLLSVLVALFPALYINRLMSFKALGLVRLNRDGLKKCLYGGLVGLVSMVLLFVSGVCCGSYAFHPSLSTVFLSLQALLFVFGALIVGVVEELIFRGALFGMLKRGFGVWIGAIVAGVIFAAVHFADPESPSGVVYGHWNAGLKMIAYMFTSYDFIPHTGYLFGTLLCMGIMLCFYYVLTGNLYFGIGLHASWVWAMRIGSLMFTREEDIHVLLFGPSMTVAKSGLALLFAVILLLISVVLYAGKRRKEKAD